MGIAYSQPVAPHSKQEALRQFVNNSTRPLFYSVDSEQFSHGQGFGTTGFEGGYAMGESDCSAIGISARSRDLLQRVVATATQGCWERFRRNKLLHQYGDFLVMPARW